MADDKSQDKSEGAAPADEKSQDTCEGSAPTASDAPPVDKRVSTLSKDEHDLWLERSGRPVYGLDKTMMSKCKTAAPLIFKMRYKIGNEDSRLTRWFGTTRLADYEMQRRDVQLGLVDGAPGRSPLTTVRVAAAVAAVLLLLALVGFGVLLAVRLGCPTAADAAASSAAAVDATDATADAADAAAAAAVDATDDARPCGELINVKAWTNCSRACSLADGYPTTGEELSAGSDCTRVLWKACFGPDACWPTPTDTKVPPTLECVYGDKHHEDLYGAQDKADSCTAKSSYCYAFAPYEGGKVYYGCYEGGAKTTKIVPANKTVGCGKNMGNYSCALVAADLVGLVGKFVGQLCCCHGSRCNVNKTLAQRAIDKMQANSTCEGATKADDKDAVRSLDGAPTGLQQCKSGGLCIDYAVKFDETTYKHSRGCDHAGDTFKNHTLQCAKQLGKADRVCFTTDSDNRKHGVCCCRGSNCTADNAFDYLFPSATTTSGQPDAACSLNYALLDGAPGEDGGGGGGGATESGCVTGLTRVPPAVVVAACALGCFATHDVDGADVSLCCCSDVDCAPADVSAFVANKAAATTAAAAAAATTAAEAAATTAAEAAATTAAEAAATTAAEAAATTAAEAAASDCGWALWAAVACVLLGLLLVAPVLAVGLYLLNQFSWANEHARWERIYDMDKPKDEWSAGLRALVDECWAAIDADERQD